MELNGMCLIWGWQSSNCFLFELLPAWLGTAVIETIMFHSSLGIICLKSSFNAVLFSLLEPLLLPLRCSQGLHLFCAPSFWPSLGNSSTQRTWSWCFLGPAPSAPSCFAHGLTCSSGHRAPFIQPQGSALPLAQSSGDHILAGLSTFPFKAKNLQWLLWTFCYVWPPLSAAGPGPACAVRAANGKAARVTLPPICALFCCFMWFFHTVQKWLWQCCASARGNK